MSSLRTAIVIPAYNASSTIAETLNSIQQCKNINAVSGVYVCDDASQDNTAEISVASWSSKAPLHIWRNDTNCGERQTLNLAFRKLVDSIDWAFVIHADDLAKPNWLDLYLPQMRCARSDLASISSSWDTWFPHKGLVVPGDDYLERTSELIEGGRDSVIATLGKGCWWRISGCAIKLDAFFRVGEFRPDLPQVGDLEWVLRCLRTGFGVEFVPRTSVLYRQHANSVSSGSFRRALDLRELLELYEEYFRDGYLSPREWRAFRMQTAYSALKRMVRGLQKGDVLQFSRTFRVLAATANPRIGRTAIGR